jgi:hypothetical protein
MAIVRYNPDRTLCEVQIGEDVYGPLDATEIGHTLIDDDAGEAYYFVIDEDGLASDTLYRLEPMETEVEEGVEFEEAEESDATT